MENAVLHAPSGPQPTSQYEHSSIPATVKKIFNLKDFLTKRDAWADTFDIVLNRTTPRTDCLETFPKPMRLRDFEAKENKKLSDFQEELVQLGASLKGDEKMKDSPLVEMTVAEAAEYSNGALKVFMDMFGKAK